MARPSSVVKCERHGLRYDAAKTSGCVVCRRESGAPPAAARSGSLGMPLAVTAILLLVTAFALQAVHTELREWLVPTGAPGGPGVSGASVMGTTPDEQKQMEKVLEELKHQGGGPDAP